MFDIFAKLLSSVASFLFPLFASYKALKTSDPAQLTPWLMYWVVLGCVLLVESWTEWFLYWIPFYAYIRLLFLLYLVLPQTQGARLIYEEHIHPLIEENEAAIEEFIASAHDRLRSAGVAYLKNAIEFLKTNLLGLPPSPPEPAAAPQPQSPQSYTQTLLARFTMPSARWATAATATAPAGGTGTSGGLTSDFYNLLASAVTAAATATTSASSSRQSPTTTTTASGSRSTTTTTTASGSRSTTTTTIIPEPIRSAGPAACMTFIQAQRERLGVVMSMLEREEAAASLQQDLRGAMEEESQQQTPTPTQTHDPDEVVVWSLDVASQAGASDRVRSLSGQSGTSGLSKTRSEGDFEKLDVPSSCGEEEEDEVEGGGVRRRRGGKGGAAGPSPGGGGGRRMWPWAWGSGAEGEE
ncbi:hypothetical protein N658DRAFT_525526 [Parathielavia hyrcaniae]|uniref:Protein YOP1 n=1 Tax=Parathielavia hyrcaniae TaxID=113614 RepID=A0AAN6PX83_9PEZI|nr:hypothetical protein N658DRAFT_525526 [Parathielavia hyrcaniae]